MLCSLVYIGKKCDDNLSWDWLLPPPPFLYFCLRISYNIILNDRKWRILFFQILPSVPTNRPEREVSQLAMQTVTSSSTLAQVLGALLIFFLSLLDSKEHLRREIAELFLSSSSHLFVYLLYSGGGSSFPLNWDLGLLPATAYEGRSSSSVQHTLTYLFENSVHSS